MSNSSAERMRLKRARDTQKGFCEVTVKVPRERVEELRELAARWCESYGGQGVTGDGQISLLE